MYVSLEIIIAASLKKMCNPLGENVLKIFFQPTGTSSILLVLLYIYKHQLLRLQALKSISVFVRQNLPWFKMYLIYKAHVTIINAVDPILPTLALIQASCLPLLNIGWCLMRCNRMTTPLLILNPSKWPSLFCRR
jgi:hypothetical protein